MGHLVVIVSGAPAYFSGSFSLAMDVANTFAVSGGVHAPTGDAPYTVSGFSLVVFVFVFVLTGVGIRRATHRHSALAGVATAPITVGEGE
jgi:hypothetical protein